MIKFGRWLNVEFDFDIVNLGYLPQKNNLSAGSNEIYRWPRYWDNHF